MIQHGLQDSWVCNNLNPISQAVITNSQDQVQSLVYILHGYEVLRYTWNVWEIWCKNSETAKKKLRWSWQYHSSSGINVQSSLFSYQMNIYQCFQYRVITRSNTLVSSDVTITNTLYPQTNNHTPHHATVSTSYKQLTIHSKDCYLMVGMESEHCIHCSVIHVCSALVQLFVQIIICLS